MGHRFSRPRWGGQSALLFRVGFPICTCAIVYLLYHAKNPPGLPRKDLLRDGYDGMRRMIREKEPERPSTRLRKFVRRNRTSLIHGELVSPRIDAAYLGQNRAAWKPIKILLEQANWAAVTHEVRGLDEKIACLQVLSGHWQEYDNQCNSLVAGLDRSGTYSLTPMLLSPDHPAMALKTRALEMARWLAG